MQDFIKIVRMLLADVSINELKSQMTRTFPANHHSQREGTFHEKSENSKYDVYCRGVTLPCVCRMVNLSCYV